MHVGHTGRGYAKAATRRLVEEAFALPEVGHVEIRCDEANVASAAVARRVGFHLVRVEHRDPRTPAETAREMVWVLTRDEVERYIVWRSEGLEGTFDIVVALIVLMDVPNFSILPANADRGGVLIAKMLHASFFLQRSVRHQHGGSRMVGGYLESEEVWCLTAQRGNAL